MPKKLLKSENVSLSYSNNAKEMRDSGARMKTRCEQNLSSTINTMTFIHSFTFATGRLIGLATQRGT